eukprot:CAMPEP_0183598798 /NCGR_PEP_ID=MMETSP0371-20130417/179108_1 /TAXON_ID=268820 /ORGANISM="Peridinium aciculiferum, Strain PAER-2" /LENGTH=192 /DNA_ID=CAMNT_0025810859 /DNA_START=73 /DNA_END=651 /DNA_ORIENTATION=-
MKTVQLPMPAMQSPTLEARGNYDHNKHTTSGRSTLKSYIGCRKGNIQSTLCAAMERGIALGRSFAQCVPRGDKFAYAPIEMTSQHRCFDRAVSNPTLGVGRAIFKAHCVLQWKEGLPSAVPSHRACRMATTFAHALMEMTSQHRCFDRAAGNSAAASPTQPASPRSPKTRPSSLSMLYSKGKACSTGKAHRL